MTPAFKLHFSTCKLIADVVPGVLSVDPTGWSTVSLQVLLQIPALSFIKGVEEEGELMDIWLHVLTSPEGAGLTNHQWAN